MFKAFKKLATSLTTARSTLIFFPIDDGSISTCCHKILVACTNEYYKAVQQIKSIVSYFNINIKVKPEIVMYSFIVSK